MPKQRSRRKAAPRNLAEPDINADDSVNLIPVTNEPSIPVIYRPPRRSRSRAQSSAPTPVVEENSANSNSPSANDIADALFRKFQDSGMQLTKNNSVLPRNDIAGLISATPTSPIQPSLCNNNTSSINSHSVPVAVTSSSLSIGNIQNSINSTQSTVSVPVPSVAVFQPPLTSDPNLINLPTGEQSVSSSSNTDSPYSCHLLRHSIPIHFHVVNSVKADIWADNYVKLVDLLPSSHDDSNPPLFESSTITITNKKSKKELLSIHQWTYAFDIFMSQYIWTNI